MSHAKPVEAIVVLNAACIDGVFCVIVACVDFDAFKALPSAVEYEGRILGKTGWNSDNGTACFQSNARLAYPVR